MISFREKELLMVQKMLQDDTGAMIEQALSILDSADDLAFCPEDDANDYKKVDTYDELVDLAREKGYHTYLRVEDILSPEELEEIDRRKDEIEQLFSKKTGIINKLDLSFLALAVGLQCVRQYVLSAFEERMDDQTAAKKVKGTEEEHSNRKHKYYCPSLDEVITNPVPFDANIGSNGALAGGGKLGHRATAIGHDPIVGLVIGTANIATSTLTTWDMRSFHIKTNNKRDVFGEDAYISKIFKYTKKKLFDEGPEGKAIVFTSLLKEIKHLQSDLNTKNSLPFPIVSTISPQLSSSLAEYGIDMANVVTVTKQATYAALINWLIGALHGLCIAKGHKDDADFEANKKLYEVRTRKILLLSNLLATTSNLIYVALTKDTKKLDVGGMLVTVSRLFMDVRFITRVKQEFIEGEINKQFEEELKELFLEN